MDYVASDERIGKRIGDDLNEGETLPLSTLELMLVQKKKFIDQAIQPYLDTNLTNMIKIFESIILQNMLKKEQT